jgi:hypothetical protein
MAQIHQFKDRAKAQQMREVYAKQGYHLVMDTDETIVLDRSYLTGIVKWFVAIVFFPIGLLGFMRRKVTLMIDEPVKPSQPPMIADGNKGTGDLYSEMLKLDDLKKRGLITDDEFQMQKRKLL